MPQPILPYVQAVKRAPVAKTAAADAGLGEWIDGPSGRSTEESTLTSCATPPSAWPRRRRLTATYPGAEAMGARPVVQSAAGVVWAAALPDDGPRGGFFRDGKSLHW
jgi:hypothetical protein